MFHFYSHLVDILKQAIVHKGFSIVDVFSPCVTYNKDNTYKWFKSRVRKLEDENHDPTDLRKALSAYERAAKFRDVNVSLLPDLYYNRAEVHTYTQNYTKAVADYRTAFEIDPIGLQSEERIEIIKKKVKKASDLVKKKGGLKPKRLIAMCKAMMTNKHHLKLIEKVQNNKDDKLKAEERMKVFNKDILHWKNYDYVVINDNLQDCFNQICNLIDSEIKDLDLSCFNGDYVTGDITNEYLDWLEKTCVS